MNQNRRSLFGLALFLAVSVWSDECLAAGQNRFCSEANGYSVALPDGWTQIPRSIIAEGLNKVASAEARGIACFEAAFQRDASNTWFRPPYVMVQAIDYSKWSNGQIDEDEFAEVVKGITSVGASELFEKALSTEVLDLVTGASIGRAYLDRENRLFVYTLEGIINNVGNVRTMRVGHFGCQTLIITGFTDLVSNWNESKPERNLILSSFRFEPAAAYKEAPQSPVGFLDRDAMRGLSEVLIFIVLIVICGGITAARAYIRWRTRQKE